jgi:hypothetical protein
MPEISEEHLASIFMIEKQARNHKNNVTNRVIVHMLIAGFLLGLHISYKGGGDMLRRNVEHFPN